MTKSRRRPTRRAKAKPARKVARKPVRKITSKKPGRPVLISTDGVVHLKPLYDEIGRTIGELERLPQTERVKFTISRLSQTQSDFEAFCGPTMDIPSEPPPQA